MQSSRLNAISCTVHGSGAEPPSSRSSGSGSGSGSGTGSGSGGSSSSSSGGGSSSSSSSRSRSRSGSGQSNRIWLPLCQLIMVPLGKISDMFTANPGCDSQPRIAGKKLQ